MARRKPGNPAYGALALTPHEAVARDAPITSQPPAASPITWERALDQWKLRLRSDDTRATYLSHVRGFVKVAATPTPRDLTSETLEAYAGALAYRAGKDAPVGGDAKRLSPATVNLKLAALRSFLQFARKRGWLAPDLTGELITDALTGITAHVQRPYQIVERQELGAMLDAAADSANPARMLALVGLALGSGLRLAELCALNVGDLATDATSCYLDVREGKGRKDRQVPIAEDVYTLALAYLKETGRAVWNTADRATPLFLSRNRASGKDGGRLSRRQAERLVESCAARAGMQARGKRITAHSLRHSYAIRVLKGDAAAGQAGAPLPAVTKLLGHSSVAITGRYLAHFERGELAEYAPKLR